MAQSLTDIKQLLAAHGLRPKKKHGQNFLHDGNHMARILEASHLTPGRQVLEVGAGTGALTERLLDAGAHVVAVEIDPDLEPILRERLGADRGALRLIIGDALEGKHRLNPVVIEALGGRDFTLIANLPYHVASPLLVNLALDHPPMRRAVVMVQKEVADRLAATPAHGKAYGPLGIIIQALFAVRRVGVLSPGCFYPPPSIASAVVALDRRDEPLTDDAHAFAAFVHKLFGKRRKQIGAILGRDTPLPAGVCPEARPETLGLEEIAALERWIDQRPAAT
jgi:16S rRNA (adenine1518-N6/adenine1519-N6)-dimethyltransferase